MNINKHVETYIPMIVYQYCLPQRTTVYIKKDNVRKEFNTQDVPNTL